MLIIVAFWLNGWGPAAPTAEPGHHTVSDSALFPRSAADTALFVHTVSDREALG